MRATDAFQRFDGKTLLRIIDGGGDFKKWMRCDDGALILSIGHKKSKTPIKREPLFGGLVRKALMAVLDVLPVLEKLEEKSESPFGLDIEC